MPGIFLWLAFVSLVDWSNLIITALLKSWGRKEGKWTSFSSTQIFKSNICSLVSETKSDQGTKDEISKKGSQTETILERY